MNFKRLFGCDWEKIGVDNRHEKVPRWVEKSYWKGWKTRKVDYNTSIQLKGKTFVYKIVTSDPRFQGDTPRTYYRRLRGK